MKNVYMGLLFVLMVPAYTYAADTTITNQVTIQTNSSSECKTDVTITTNGEVKTYHSTDCNQNVEVKSDNGSPKPSRVITQPSEKEATDTPTRNPTQTIQGQNTPKIRETFLSRILKHLEFIKKIRFEIKL